MTLSQIKFKTHPMGSGKQGLVFFPNGYGASIVGGGPGLYGDGVNTFELAVLKGNEDEWSLCYDTPITDGVLGWLNRSEVNMALSEIEALPK